MEIVICYGKRRIMGAVSYEKQQRLMVKKDMPIMHFK
jgi:hypothetical protein